jgi:hypothetical protein
MKRLIFVAALSCSFWCTGIKAQTQNFDNLALSLLTAAPGNDLYAAFGHSAIRMRDTVSGYDAVFNYGLFDFNAPGFYTNFARGRMNYCLGIQSYERFVAVYAYENRAVWEQVLALDATQKDFIIRFLYNNALPENRFYLYHFFLDNCATRIRDLAALTYEGLEFPATTENPTYRELIYRYLQDHPWGRFGIDIALGLPTDRKTDLFAQMFLPDYLSHAFAHATCNGQPIVKETRDIVIPDGTAISPPSWFSPMVLNCMLLALALLCCFVRKAAKVFDFILFLTVGFVGLLVASLWFLTDHTNTLHNLNIIWALPTHAVMAFFLIPQKRTRFVRQYFLATAAIAALLLIVWAFLPQHLNPALIPLTIAIGLRALTIFISRAWKSENFHLLLRSNLGRIAQRCKWNRKTKICI